MSRFRWRYSLLLSPAQRLLKQVQMEDVYSQSTDSNQQHWRGERDGKERGRNGRDRVREGDIRYKKRKECMTEWSERIKRMDGGKRREM